MRQNPPTRATLAVLVLALVTAATAPSVSVLLAANAPQAAAGRNEEIAMTVGKSVILDHPDEIARISISNPEVADAVAVSSKEVLLNAKSSGITTLVIWSKSGERNFFTISVGPNLQQIQQQLQSTFPGENIQVVPGQNAVSLTGKVSSPAVVEKAVVLAAGPGRPVVSNLSVPVVPDKQILLKVRFAEVQKTALEQL
ncbi:MAG: pilus assembly protein N-terminal domain-containing protein [Acidobacteria bacterium]|nr:pilus assembly protein N-terminal domain-containing protein [Acidobacteriota bacterium]